MWRAYILEARNAVWVSRLPLPLVERSKEEIARRIKRKVERLSGVKSCGQLNVRLIGKRYDVNMRVVVDSDSGSDDPHKISLKIEKEVKSILPNSRVSIDTEPFGDSRENVWRFVKETAEGTPGSRGVHNIHIQEIDGELCIDLHLEVSANMTVKQAHYVADQVEKKIKTGNPDISEVTVHIESASDRISRELAGIERELESYVQDVAKRFPEIKEVHEIRVRRFGDTMHLVLHCTFDSKLSIEKAHEFSSKVESAVRKAYPNVIRIDIHEEPA
jgi:divalent metal cation (Fe/Co/Zn/Cd) transporter